MMRSFDNAVVLAVLAMSQTYKMKRDGVDNGRYISTPYQHILIIGFRVESIVKMCSVFYWSDLVSGEPGWQEMPVIA